MGNGFSRWMVLNPFFEWAKTLRYPTLFKLTAALFLLNVLIPDPLPFIDEIVMGLVTMIIASRKKSVAENEDAGAD